MGMIRIGLLAAALALTGALVAGAEQTDQRLTIIRTDNLQSRVVAEQNEPGLAEIAAVVEEARAQTPTLVIDTGQQADPPPAATPTLEAGEAFLAALKELGIDAMVPGPADRAYGEGALELLAGNAPFEVVPGGAAAVGTSVLVAGDARLGLIGVSAPPRERIPEMNAADAARVAQVAAAGLETLEDAGVSVVALVTQYPLRDLYEAGRFTQRQYRWAARYAGRIDLIIEGSQVAPGEELARLQGGPAVVSASGMEAIEGIRLSLTGGDVTAVEAMRIDRPAIVAAGLEPDPALQEQAQRVAMAAGLDIPGDEPTVATVEQDSGATAQPLPSARGRLLPLYTFAAPSVSLYADTQGLGGRAGVFSTVGELFSTEGPFAPLTIGMSVLYDGALQTSSDYVLNNSGATLVLGWRLRIGELLGGDGFLSLLRMTPLVELGAVYQQREHLGREGYAGAGWVTAAGVDVSVQLPVVEQLFVGARLNYQLIGSDELIRSTQLAPAITWRF